jgi:hypothetical protein
VVHLLALLAFIAAGTWALLGTMERRLVRG